MVKVALLIGVSEYEPGLNPLPASVKDMQAIAKVLQHPEMGGFAEADLKKLENPDPQKMQEAIETLFSNRRKDDLTIVYFSGHGIKDESGKLYLATRLTRKNSQGQLIKSTAVPASFIHNIMSESRSKRQVIILDCCFSGAFAEGWSAKDDSSVDIRSQLGGEGRVALTSSTSTQYSFQQEGANLSTYTRYLVEGIETGAADLDNDGAVSIDELHEYAKKKVQEAAPAMQPEIYAHSEGFKILLAKAPTGDPKLRYRKEVEIYASRGEISIIGRKILDALRQNLGLVTEETAVIETEVLKPYQDYKQKLQQYEQALVDAIAGEPTLSDYTRNDLQRYQQILGLRNEDIAPIEQRILSRNQLSSKRRIDITRRTLSQPQSLFEKIVLGKKKLIAGGAIVLIGLVGYPTYEYVWLPSQSLEAKYKLITRTHEPLLPPQQSIIPSKADGGTAVVSTGIKRSNFITEVTLYNPTNTTNIKWKYGFSFRETAKLGDNQRYVYTLCVTSDKRWKLDASTPIASNNVPNLNISNNNPNKLGLIVKDKQAILFVNDERVATMDISLLEGVGQIYLVVSSDSSNKSEVYDFKYEDFKVWSLDN
ncbi:caspase domain-containing protein [uncultured Nostoc sp.]|uniref:caspase family protein n=1 Tax=uncultured Nostoc sp. TaxID=340711 RepID=UPI0035CB2104